MKAISLHAPWGSLCVTRQPDPVSEVYPDLPPKQMVKRFETRTRPCPPHIIGQRIAIHQALRGMDKPTGDDDWVIGDFRKQDGRTLTHPTLGAIDLPLGAIVGSAVITASLPIVEGPEPCETPHVHDPCPGVLVVFDGEPGAWRTTDISDQLPYGDWTPGRYAWQLEQAAPTTERCPWCWGMGWTCYSGEARYGAADDIRLITPGTCTAEHAMHDVCSVCNGDGSCDPIPATGRQGWWTWEPT